MDFVFALDQEHQTLTLSSLSLGSSGCAVHHAGLVSPAARLACNSYFFSLITRALKPNLSFRSL